MKIRGVFTQRNFLLRLFWTLLFLAPGIYFSICFVQPLLAIAIFIPGIVFYWLPVENFLSKSASMDASRLNRTFLYKLLPFDIEIPQPSVDSRKKNGRFYRLRLKRRILHLLLKFHWHLASIFLFLFLYSLYIENLAWAIFLMLSNVLYNWLPILIISRRMAAKG